MPIRPRRRQFDKCLFQRVDCVGHVWGFPPRVGCRYGQRRNLGLWRLFLVGIVAQANCTILLSRSCGLHQTDSTHKQSSVKFQEERRQARVEEQDLLRRLKFRCIQRKHKNKQKETLPLTLCHTSKVSELGMGIAWRFHEQQGSQRSTWQTNTTLLAYDCAAQFVDTCRLACTTLNNSSRML